MVVLILFVHGLESGIGQSAVDGVQDVPAASADLLPELDEPGDAGQGRVGGPLAQWGSASSAGMERHASNGDRLVNGGDRDVAFYKVVGGLCWRWRYVRRSLMRGVLSERSLRWRILLRIIPSTRLRIIPITVMSAISSECVTLIKINGMWNCVVSVDGAFSWKTV